MMGCGSHAAERDTGFVDYAKSIIGTAESRNYEFSLLSVPIVYLSHDLAQAMNEIESSVKSPSQLESEMRNSIYAERHTRDKLNKEIVELEKLNDRLTLDNEFLTDDNKYLEKEFNELAE